MFGTIVNALAIIAGSLAGFIFKKHIKEGLEQTVFNGIGVLTLVIGVSMAITTQRMLFLALSLVIGGAAGYALKLEERILGLGAFLERIFFKKAAGKQEADMKAAVEGRLDEIEAVSGKSVPEAFLDASLIFCVGAMAIVGSIQAGAAGDYSLLFTKSVMDGAIAVMLTAALGFGVILSAVSVFLYQGILTAAGYFLGSVVPDLVIGEISAVGGAMIMMIGINLLKLKKIRTGDFLPALVITVILVLGEITLMPLFS